MGMPMSGMMGHGQGGGDGADKVAADRKIVTPPQPHTEQVTGRVPDRTAAAAEASRTRADSDAGCRRRSAAAWTGNAPNHLGAVER